MTDVNETDEPIHEHFGLTYANYLVLNRTLLQSMPIEWQRRFVACLEDLNVAFDHVEQAETFFVHAAIARELWELSEHERKQVLEGLVTRESEEGNEQFYVDTEAMEPWQRVHLPVTDPVPHYDRGRTHIEPKP